MTKDYHKAVMLLWDLLDDIECWERCGKVNDAEFRAWCVKKVAKRSYILNVEEFTELIREVHADD